MVEQKFVHVNGMKFLRVRVGDMEIDEAYQRRLDERRAKKIGDSWDAALGGIVVVSLRANGKLYVIDGQHRVWGLKLAGKDDLVLAVDVRQGLTQREEADLFVRLNGTRSPVRVYDAFRARIIAEEQEAVRINQIIIAAGLKLSASACKNGIAAVGAMCKVHRRYDTLQPTLSVLHTWSRGTGHDPAAYDKRLVRHVGRFLFEFPTADPGDLAVRLVRSGRPDTLIAKISREVRGYKEDEEAEAATMSLLEVYNTRNRRKLTREDRRNMHPEKQAA